MPTPESEAFLAKKPKVPPTFDGVDYDDNKALKAAQDSVVREQWVQVMMGRLVREELSKCYYREGVNHLEKCGHLRGQLQHTYRHTLPCPILCLLFFVGSHFSIFKSLTSLQRNTCKCSISTVCEVSSSSNRITLRHRKLQLWLVLQTLQQPPGTRRNSRGNDGAWKLESPDTDCVSIATWAAAGKGRQYSRGRSLNGQIRPCRTTGHAFGPCI